MLGPGFGAPLADEHASGRVEQHDADARPIRQVARLAAALGHPRPSRMAALAGTSSRPFASRPLLQRAMRSMESGKALATPIARPRSRASASSFSSSL